MALISVTQYALRTGKDPGNIRRLLASGRLSGILIGRQWAIEEGTPYPKDRRVRAGRYRDWRKRAGVFKDRRLARSVNAMLHDLQTVYGNYLKSVILYGSYARGSQTVESDIDIALVLAKGAGKKHFHRMVQCVAEREVECGKTLSVIEVDEGKYAEWKDTLPFYRNIEQEGIVLWTKE